MSLGKRIKQVREELELSPRELAELVGVTRQLVPQWENGTIQDIKLATFIKLYKKLKVQPEWLVTGNGIKKLDGITEPISVERQSWNMAYDQFTPMQRDLVSKFLSTLMVKKQKQRRGS